jgi:hypothetical protein
VRLAAGGSREDVTRVYNEANDGSAKRRLAIQACRTGALGGTPPNEMFSLIDQEIRRDSKPGNACEGVLWNDTLTPLARPSPNLM